MSQQNDPFIAQGTGVTTTEGYLPEDMFIEPMPRVDVQSGTTAPTDQPNTQNEPPASDVDFLRMLLQEPIPPNGSDSSTLFLDQNLVDILNRTPCMSAAAALGWAVKKAALLVLTDRNDGLSEKKLSQAATAAQPLINYWNEIAQQDLASLGRSWASPGAAFTPYVRDYNNLWNSVYDQSHPDLFWLPYNVIEG